MMRTYEYDVVVVGGGSAGIAATIAAARSGVKTLMIERASSFGGQSTNSGVTSYCGFHTRGQVPTQVVEGIGEEVLETLRKFGAGTDYTISEATGNVTTRFDPELMKSVLDDLLEQSPAEYLLHAQVFDVFVKEGKIESVTCVDDAGHFTVKGTVFIDASGDANLCNLADVPTLWGDENGRTQLASLPIRFEKLPPNVEFMPEQMETAIKKGKADGLLPMGKEKGLIIKVPSDDFGFCTIPSYYLESLDARELTRAEIDLRKQSLNYAEAFRRYVPGLEYARISQTGPTIGIRESRRIIGEEYLTGEDILAGRKRSDGIARGGWSPDIHISNTDLRYVHLKDNDYFDIPLGCLKPKTMENLWACGRIISCDSLAHASVRVMGTGFATGQAAGAAAAIQSKKGYADVSEVREVLRNQGALV